MDTAIILVNYNGNDDTINCVESIQQTAGIDLPYVVVVDNNSVQKTIDEQIAFYPHYKVLYNTENVGFGKANNIGIKWVLENLDTEYIFLLNNDTIIYPSTLRILRDELKRSPEEYGVVTPRILFYHNPKLAWYDGGYLSRWRFGPTVDNFNEPYDPDTTPKDVTFISGCAMFFKTNVLRKETGFHPIFFMYEEDLELSIRLQKHGIKMRYAPEAVILHKEFGSQKDRPENWLSAFDPQNKKAVHNLYSRTKNRMIVVYMHRSSWIKEYRFLLFYPVYLLKHSLVLIKNGHKGVLSSVKKAFSESYAEYSKYKENEARKS